jgi:hypothetical protein
LYFEDPQRSFSEHPVTINQWIFKKNDFSFPTMVVKTIKLHSNHIKIFIGRKLAIYFAEPSKLIPALI